MYHTYSRGHCNLTIWPTSSVIVPFPASNEVTNQTITLHRTCCVIQFVSTVLTNIEQKIISRPLIKRVDKQNYQTK